MNAFIYRSLTRYKYQLTDGYETRIHEFKTVAGRVFTGEHGWVVLTDMDKLEVKEGYCWDGPSGPTIHTPNFMRGSLVHDALYQLMRDGQLSRGFKEASDRVLQRLCVEDGMSKIRAWWVYQGVKWFGHGALKK